MKRDDDDSEFSDELDEFEASVNLDKKKTVSTTTSYKQQ